MRWLLNLFCILVVSIAGRASTPGDDWLPVSPQDFQIKDVPGNPGAAAIQLYYADFIDDNDHSESIYHRIKVLTDGGKKYGNVEIAVPFGRNLKDLKARTIRSDGSVVEFTGKPFEKVLYKSQGVKLYAKTLTLPEVAVGGIIEYKYLLENRDKVVYNNQWIVEHDLFTVKEHFLFKYNGSLQALYVAPNALTTQIKNKKGTVELELDNVPAFSTEEQMPPTEIYKLQVRFFFSFGNFSSPDLFWQRSGELGERAVEEFIGNHKEAHDAALEAIGDEPNPEKKLRKLYARAQQVRNLTYERRRTDVEQKKEQLKENTNVADVIKHGYGSREEIDALFVAMARAAGFSSSILLVSNRQSRFFEKNVLSRGQLDSEMVVVQLNGKSLVLDPGTRFCPFGMMRWMRSGTTALQLDKNNVHFVETPLPAAGGAVVTRVANVTLGEDGSLKGNVKVEFKGGEALERRLDGTRTDDAGRAKDLEDELKSWLPEGALVKLTGVKGWEATDDPLTADFQIEIPSYGSVAGKRLLAPAFLFQTKPKYLFRDAPRKYPVYFPFAFGEVDRVTISMPPGYSVESLPEKKNEDLAFAHYQNLCQVDGQRMVVQRVLAINKLFFTPEEYGGLTTFFREVTAGDGSQTVLHQAAKANPAN